MSQHKSLDDFLQQRIVCDTQGPLIYIGRLTQWDENGYWLAEAEVHDRSDGHSTKEMFLFDAYAAHRRGEDRMNRRTIYIDRHTVASISLLKDVTGESAAPSDFGLGTDIDALP